MLRPQDILVLLKIATQYPEGNFGQQELALSLGLSQAEVHKVLQRAAKAGLYNSDLRKVQRHALLEFILHGLKYVYPAQLGSPARGIPTAWAAPPLSDKIAQGGDLDRPVWAHPDGSVRGSAVEPLYKTAANVALQDAEMHELLALVDAIRFGRARERNMASKILTKRLSAK
jgi:hypothetical protein